MLVHSGGSFADVGIDEPEDHMLCGELVFDALDLRDVAVGYRAVRCDKEENDGYRTGSRKLSYGVSIQVVAVGRWLWLCTRNKRNGQRVSQSQQHGK